MSPHPSPHPPLCYAVDRLIVTLDIINVLRYYLFDDKELSM